MDARTVFFPPAKLAERLNPSQIDHLCSLSPGRIIWSFPTMTAWELHRLDLIEPLWWCLWRVTPRGQAVQAALKWAAYREKSRFG